MRAIPTRRARGFTLLEMLAVIALTALLLTVAADYYIDLSRAGSEAVERVAGPRRAARLLDRLAREVEGSVLVVKPPELDPIAWPWVFLAEADDESAGAQRVKFVTRSHRPTADALREQDLALVSYVASADDGEGIVLWRAASPQLPEELDLSFPRDERDGAQILSEELAAFGMRFLTEEGEWLARFDSSSLIQSGQLPLAAEIELAFLELDDQGEQVAGPSYRRRVILPLRPLDIEEELEAAGELAGSGDEAGEEADEQDEGEQGDGSGGPTVGDCLDTLPPARLAQLPAQQRSILDSMKDQPLTDELRSMAGQLGIQCP